MPRAIVEKNLDKKDRLMLWSGMLRKALSGPVLTRILLCFQVVPLLLLPGESWTLLTQEWWLPVLLTALVLVALVQLLIRHSRSSAPWYILSFAQGFSIISRLMMLLPHATVARGDVQRFDPLYVLLAVISMALSTFELWYCDLPEVRNRLA
jgi:hypothetical protein